MGSSAIIRDLIGKVEQNKDANPLLALVFARQAVESVIRQLGGMSASPTASLSLNESISALERDGLLLRGQASALHQVRQLANPAIHGKNSATIADATKAFRLLKGLNEFWLTSSVDDDRLKSRIEPKSSDLSYTNRPSDSEISRHFEAASSTTQRISYRFYMRRFLAVAVFIVFSVIILWSVPFRQIASDTSTSPHL